MPNTHPPMKHSSPHPLARPRSAASAKRPRVLRKSCDACSKAKVKCDGDGPCIKCQIRGVACVFSPEQKRGPRTFLVLVPASRLQKRAFRVVLSLFKFHRNARDVDWFASQFAALASLSHGARSAARLAEFMAHHQLHLTPRSRTAAAISLVNLPESLVPLRPLLPKDEQTFLGCIQAASTGKVKCNAELTAWLGVSKSCNNLCLPKEPVLPFGLDAFCAISDNDSQVVALARDLLRQRNSAGQESTVFLLDRRVSVLAKSGPVRCYLSVQFTQAPASTTATESEWTTRFFFFLAHGLERPGLELPDLELPSFPLAKADDDWLHALLEWV